MRKNYYTVITGSKVVLVSYKKEHVLKYHSWMQNEQLRKLTASEPLTLYEEYIMQASWYTDKNKCTFIILDKETYSYRKDEVESMIGDVNIYFTDPNEPHTAEAEIMIAEPSHRRQGKGFEALLLMIHYGICDLKIRKYIVKISRDNEPSLSLFTKIGFKFLSMSAAFKEVTLTKKVDYEWKQSIEKNINFIKVKNCDIKLIAALAARRKERILQKQKEKKQRELEEKEREKKQKELEEKEKEEKKEEEKKEETKEEEKKEEENIATPTTTT